MCSLLLCVLCLYVLNKLTHSYLKNKNKKTTVISLKEGISY